MSVFRQDRPEEARAIFRQSEALMPPLPQDDLKPHVDGRTIDQNILIWWLAYKEAKALLEGPSEVGEKRSDPK
jgi:hypothetical protein